MRMSEISPEQNEQDSGYILHVDNFEGPLDLLWDLIRKSRIDIADISLSDITEQYLRYLKNLESLNIRVASEFIWMGAQLLYYKSRALLPGDPMEDEFFVPPLPPELVQKLLEYKKYQQAALTLAEQGEENANLYSREADPEHMVGSEEYMDVSLFDLLKAFARVMDSHVEVEQEEILFDEILVSDRIEHITSLLTYKEEIIFDDIFSVRPSRHEIVASFLAILEMSKARMLYLLQEKIFDIITLRRRFSLDTLSGPTELSVN